MWKIILLVFFFVFRVLGDVETEFVFEKFNWQEYTSEGKLLEEDGWREGCLISYGDFDCEVLFGSVNYDGHRWNGEAAQATTDYFLLNPQIDREFNFFSYGVGVDMWIRGVGKGKPEIGGYNEYWLLSYGKIGLFWEYFSLDYNIPFDCENNVHETTLEPHVDPFFTFSISLERKKFCVGFEYRTINFERSSLQYSSYYDTNVYQPESRQEDYSLYTRFMF